jgi:hypothetical protein
MYLERMGIARYLLGTQVLAAYPLGTYGFSRESALNASLAVHLLGTQVLAGYVFGIYGLLAYGNASVCGRSVW